MKHLILSILYLCISFLSCFAQQSHTNPLYLGPILLDKPSVEAMAKLCEQYKLTEVPADDDYKTYKHPDGTLISLSHQILKVLKPYVEIHTPQSKKIIEKTILEAGYHKEKHKYEKDFHRARRFSTYQISGNKNKRVIFTKENGHILN